MYNTIDLLCFVSGDAFLILCVDPYKPDDGMCVGEGRFPSTSAVMVEWS